MYTVQANITEGLDFEFQAESQANDGFGASMGAPGSPGEGRHGGAYTKISTSTKGTIKVVDSATYKSTLGEKATIIPDKK
jgi:hypothetical protein